MEFRNSPLYGLVLTQLNELEQAEIKWKYICLRNPGLKSWYSLASFFHEKAKKYFQKNTSNIQKMKYLLKELKFCLEAFFMIFLMI